jgi:uncharacterized protein (DUF2461 family)
VVERHLAKVDVAGSSPVPRSSFLSSQCKGNAVASLFCIARDVRCKKQLRPDGEDQTSRVCCNAQALPKDAIFLLLCA